MTALVTSWILGFVARAIQHDARGAELLPAVDDGDLAGVMGQVGRLFHGRVAATYHQHLAALEQRPVAGGAGGNAAVAKLVFRGNPQPLGRGRRWR